MMPKGKEQIADDLVALIAAQTTDDIDGANDVIQNAFNRLYCSPTKVSLVDKKQHFNTLVSRFEVFLALMAEDLDVGTAECIDGLLGVAHAIEEGRLRFSIDHIQHDCADHRHHVANIRRNARLRDQQIVEPMNSHR